MAIWGKRAAAAFAAAALISLGACAGGDARMRAMTEPAPAPAATSAPTPTEAQPEAPQTPAQTSPAVAALPPSAPGTARPPEDIRRLLGTPAGVLRELMGDVVFVRRDGAAEIWRFADDSCFLDVFLYRESDGLRVAHIDARSRTTGRVTPQACYGRIINARTPKPAS